MTGGRRRAQPTATAPAAEAETPAAVALPASARLDLNYYFVLGVTPRAGTERIRKAFRQKAREVHPDVHAQDFTPGQWHELMSLLSDANTVLTDPAQRRAYDQLWRRRSQDLAAQHAKPGERRGDWETRYLWEIAEVGEFEEALVPRIESLGRVMATGEDRHTALVELRQAVAKYETALIAVRAETRALPDRLMFFSERARVEMQRKEILVQALRQLLQEARAAATPDAAAAISGRISSTLEILGRIRQAHHYFDLVHARPYL